MSIRLTLMVLLERDLVFAERSPAHGASLRPPVPVGKEHPRLNAHFSTSVVRRLISSAHKAPREPRRGQLRSVCWRPPTGAPATCAVTPGSDDASGEDDQASAMRDAIAPTVDPGEPSGPGPAPAPRGVNQQRTGWLGTGRRAGYRQDRRRLREASSGRAWGVERQPTVTGNNQQCPHI